MHEVGCNNCVSLQRCFFIAGRLLEGVNFDEFKGEGGRNTPSPKKKSVVQKRREDEIEEKEEEEEKKEKEENDTKKIRWGVARWNRGGRHIENVSQPPCSLVHHCHFYNHHL